jgi:predicted O-methyltransferase YrrM
MKSKTESFFSANSKEGEDGAFYRLDSASIRICEAYELQRLIQDNRPTRTLEIGLALGASAVAITEVLDCSASKHTVIDPFQVSAGNVGLRELDRLGLLSRVEFLPIRSEDFLAECCRTKTDFDFIFHDGAHTIGNKVADAFFADRCLRPGGIIAFHDAFLYSTAACIRYLARELGYELLVLKADVSWRRFLRVPKYTFRHGLWFGLSVVPRVCRSLVALRKPSPNVIS